MSRIVITTYRSSNTVSHFGSYRRISIGVSHTLLLLVWLTLTASSLYAETDGVASSERGEYLYRMGGCASCHVTGSAEDDRPSGGVEFKTPFGTFVSPNITPDTVTGIGGWSDRQFIEAMKSGVSPSGDHYYTIFPFTSYTLMPEQDLIDLKAYLDTLPPVSKVVKANDLSFPFNQRWLMGVWKLLFFQSGTFKPDPIRTESWNQGAYIVNGPGHCVECHTPRNLLGALKNGELLAGNPDGPDGESVPAINPSRSQSFSEWSAEDIVFSLQTGMLPDGDFLGGSMGRVVENSTSGLRGSDLKAISEYLQSPATLETGGFFSTVFETRAAVARDHSSKGKHPGMVSDFFKWIIWLLLVVGICWLSAMVYRSKSRKSQTRR